MKNLQSEKIGLAIMLLFFSSMIPVLYVGAVSVSDANTKRLPNNNSYRRSASYKYDSRVARIVFSCAPRPDCSKKSK